MQWLRSAFQLSTPSLQRCFSHKLNSAKPVLSMRRLASQASPSPTPRILVKPLKHASLEPSAGAFFVPDKGDPFHSSSDFIVILKPYPRHLVDKKGCIVESLLLPRWLPTPPHPATHQRRHLAVPMPSTRSSSSNETVGAEEQGCDDDRWEPLPLTPEAQSVGQDDAVRPILRVFLMATKKRIHKRAVIRHRVRTRLIAALRTAVVRLQDGKLDIERKLDLRRNVLMIVAHPTAYSKDMEALVDEMDKALRRVARLPAITSPTSSSSPRKQTTKATRTRQPLVCALSHARSNEHKQ